MKKIFIWSLFMVVALDLIISLATEQPKNGVQQGKLTEYFNYGLSIEKKLFRRVSNDNTTAANIAKAGWFKPKNNPDNKDDSTKKRIFIYGMSFSNHIGDILSKQDKSLDVRMFGGPGAPLNHSFAYYQHHRPHNKGDVVILGILASSLPMTNTLTHITSNFEYPAAHFYPRYKLDANNKLFKKELHINSLSELRTIMNNKKQWYQVKQTLEANDPFYDDILFSQNMTDKSVFLRLLKRAWGQREKLKTLRRYHDKTGFKNTERLIEVSQAIVRTFSQNVRSDGAIPFVILFNDRGFGDHLYKVLEPVLVNNNVLHYSTHDEYPANKLSNFISDGHFTPAIDTSIAVKVMERITANKK